MPTYEYRCAEGHEFELFQKMSDDPVATCPECGKEAQRLLSAGGFVFKGEGFYITDYKRKDEARKREREARKVEGGGEKKKADTAGGSPGGRTGGEGAGSSTSGGTSSGTGSSSSSSSSSE